MMNIRKNKTIVCIVTTLLIIAGSFLMGTPASTVEASETTTISEKVLSVKCQLSDDKTKLRMVTTIDGELQYKNVGFEVTFLGDDAAPAKTKTNTAKYVYRRINATDAAVKYEFGPKAFHASSQWIATYTVTNIPEAYKDNGIIIKPYVTMKDTGVRVYGEHRYLTMLDQTNGVVSLPVKGELTNPSVAGATVEETYFDGTYTHVRVSVDYATLPSISTYTVTDNGTEYPEKYRYLHSTVASDQSWYTESDEDDKVIITAGDMWGFQMLSQESSYNGFVGQTIYLGADIDLTPGWSASQYSWLTGSGNTDATQPTPIAWEPIGRRARNTSVPEFAGTFDGDMHTIKGVALRKWSENVLGLFGQVNGATIKNFTLSNSYFYVNSGTTYTYTGSIVGELNNGIIDTVKCDETVKIEIAKSGNQYNGGIAGRVINGTIQNCWFAGKIAGNGYYQGGILGGLSTSGDKCTIENCLFTGNLVLNQYTGGICGSVVAGAELTVSDTLYAGKMSAGGGSNYKGLIVGNLASNGQITAENLYASKDTFTKNIGWTGSTEDTANPVIDDKVTHLALEDFNGETGYLNIALDFYIPEVHEEGTWGIVEDGAPRLKIFGDLEEAEYVDVRTVGGATQAVRTVWHNLATDGADTFVLYSPADFWGFRELSQTYGFAGDTVKLGNDIDLTPGWNASQYSWLTGSGNTDATQPTPIAWEPIGRRARNTSVPEFAGTFDGDMHTIKGVALRKWSENVLGLFGQVNGATIKNFTLSNSYFYVNSGTTYTYTGSIVGELNNGIIDTVKCDETVKIEIAKSGNQYNGGIAGRVINGTIQNCWFAGKIAGNGYYQGGILGGLSTSGDKCTIENCLFTGNLVLNQYTGGICGSVVAGAELTVSDTLYAGKMSAGGGSNYKGLIVGNLASNGQITAENLYASKDTFTKNIGWTGSTEDTANPVIDDKVTHLALEDFNGETGYLNIALDFYIPEVHEEGTWGIVEDGAPRLKIFGDLEEAEYVDVRTVGGATQAVRTVWHNLATDGADTFVLYSPADFWGFRELSQTYGFAGDTVKLGNDIDLTPGWNASQYSWLTGSGNTDATQPTPIAWEPIGRRARNTSVPEFAGTFDGDMHTIKGVALRKWSENVLGLFGQVNGATIKNFTLSNSYFYVNSGSATNTYAGCIVGELNNGILDTVKCDETVKFEMPRSTSCYNGGMVGAAISGTIRNCWFAGIINSAGSHQGGIIGGLYTAGSTCTIEHCMFTGTIYAYSKTGGICGAVWTDTTLTLKDSLFAGTFEKVEGITLSEIGTVIGNTRNGISSVSNVYVQKHDEEFFSNSVGNNKDSEGNIVVPDGAIVRLEKKELYLDDARENTALTIYPQGQDTSSDGNNKQFWWYVSETHPVLASFSTPVTYDKVKVATYNIGSCIKLDKSNHASVRNDIINFIKDNNIDVCMLQEVDKDCERTGSVDQAKAIADALGYHYTYVATLENHYSGTYGWVTSYGIAIVSRYEITSTDYEHLEFSGQNERRAILKAMVDVNGTETAIFCTHFDNAEDTTVRTNAVATLKTMIDGLDASTPIIFGGDLNQAYAGDDTVVVKEVGEFLNSVTKARYDAKSTYYTDMQGGDHWVQLDYIFTNALVECGRAKVYTPTSTSLEGELSDHRPLVVNLYMNINK